MAKPSHFQETSLEPLERRTLFQLLASRASEHPHKEAIVLYDEECQRYSMTFSDYETKSQAFAVAMLEKGLARGDTVGFISPNNTEYPIVLMALNKIGANVFAIEQGFGAEELIQCLYQVKCNAAVCYVNTTDSTQAQVIQEVIKRLVKEANHFKAVITIGSAAECGATSSLVYSYSDLVSCGYKLSQSPLEEVQSRVQSQDPALVLLTSGSTGKPKAVQFTHLSLVSSALATARIVGVSGSSRVFSDTPFSWCPGMWAGLNLVPCTGATLVSIHPTSLVKKRLTEFALKVLQDEKCSSAMFVPYFIHDIIAAGELVAKYDLSCLQTGITGGQPLAQDIMKKLFALLLQVNVFLTYGSTEVALVAYQKLDKDTIDGLPYGWMQLDEHAELKITDEEGCVVPVGTGGEINIRGSTVFTKYFGNPSATSQSISQDGWHHTGDMGVVDGKGRLKVLGRKTDLIKRATENYFPAEFEGILAKHPLVARVIVVSVPDQRLFEEICACVILRESEDKLATAAELEDWYDLQWPSNADGLSWKPGYTLTFEKFPLTRTGKPDRIEIRRIAMERLNIKNDN